MKAIKLLLGGSPCTYWSIAQSKNRETEPSGMGWELFKNYLIAKEKYKPDYFLYENNYSMDDKIKSEITKQLGVEPIMINSALVSAQNRKRLYWTNIPNVKQPNDKGILLKDILESGQDLTQNEKSYCLTTGINQACAWNTIERKQRNMVAEPACIAQRGRYLESGSRSKKN
jgi:DNA (cytosine-5)-methyltransferase 3A